MNKSLDCNALLTLCERRRYLESGQAKSALIAQAVTHSSAGAMKDRFFDDIAFALLTFTVCTGPIAILVLALAAVF